MTQELEDWIGVSIVWSQIILSLILSISNSNHTQKYKYLFEKSFSLKAKKQQKKLWINFIIIKSITTFFVYVSWLKKNLSFLAISSKAATLCSLLVSYISSKVTNLCFIFLRYILKGSNSLLSPPWLLPTKNPFFLSWFHTIFLSP